MNTPTENQTVQWRNEIQEFLRTRRSIRKFKTNPISPEVLNRILDIATYAPSAHNDQPWRFVILTREPPKVRLAEAMEIDFRRDLERDDLPQNEIEKRLERSRKRIHNAPAIVILCLDTNKIKSLQNEKRKQAEWIMAIQSTALAGLQLLLAAHAEGLGGVWTCGPLFTPETTRSALELPPSWEPQAMFLIGYPDESPETPKRGISKEIARFIDE